MTDRKSRVFTVIMVSILSVITGILLGTDLLSFHKDTADMVTPERTEKTQTVTIVEHTHDGIPLHQHVVKTTIVVTETTPHGTFENPAPVAGIKEPAPTMEPVATPAMEPAATPAMEPAPVPATEPALPSPVLTVSEAKITISQREYMPRIITIRAGSSVTWTNKDFEVHTITSTDDLFNGFLAYGESFSYTFSERGTFTYYCGPHPALEPGTIIVK